MKARSFKNLAKKLPRFQLKGEGWINYRGRTCELMVDPELARYYRRLIPKHYDVKIPKWAPHITVVRKFEAPNANYSEQWYHGYYFPFVYSPHICFDGTYFYLECSSKWITKMRKEFGLEPYRFNKCYHITIGNIK
jgi:hypothetical protein